MLVSSGYVVTFLEKNIPGLFQGVELAMPGTEAAIRFGLITDGGRLNGLFLSRPELHVALLKVELVDFILIFRVLDEETLRPAIGAF
jgi:hypothetical protein